MEKILRILLSPITVIRLILVWFVTMFFLVAVIIENKTCKKVGSFRFWSARGWGRSVLFILGFWVKRNKPPKTGTYLLMPNHRSYLDVFMTAAYSPSAFVAKAELLKWPLIGSALKSGRAITVQRDNLKSMLDTMKKIQYSIENKISITIFPEGTTYLGPELGTFKNGTFKIASELVIPIIPCAINYRDENNAWVSNDKFVHHFFRQQWKPASFAQIMFGEPITGNDYLQLKEQTKAKIEEMLKAIQ